MLDAVMTVLVGSLFGVYDALAARRTQLRTTRAEAAAA